MTSNISVGDLASRRPAEPQPLRVGVLGGMGPAATARFFDLLVAATPASSDQDHLPVMIWSDPRVPDRTAALLHDGPDPTPCLEVGGRALVEAGAEVVAIPCNTAHAFIGGLGARIGVPVLDMVEETAAAVVARCPLPATVGLLATDGTLFSGLYHQAFAKRDIPVLVPEPDDQARVMRAIRAVKAGDLSAPQRQEAADLVSNLVARGADIVILGCTELPLLLSHEPPIESIDSLQCLADAVVSRAVNSERGVHR
ncbi:aspartate/glutamate racemase family protein [Nocardioides marmotae]|uniref:aspartate/glutamate racemase family protein n=1 Tax=Nocardioides marmotae TaxID=2663857 RepID=UPI001CA7E9CC|nr:amino acid racemase [Nocardioides marmotae]